MFLKQILAPVVLATMLPFLVNADAPFCQGEYKATSKLCSKNFWDYNIGKSCNPKNGTTFYDLSHFPPPDPISPRVKLIAQLITNVFENGDKIYNYAYCENLGDGNGFTAGRVGFCSGSNDALVVVKKYLSMTKGKMNLMKRFVRPLQKLADLSFCSKSKASTSSLPNYCQDWSKAACTDPKFRQAQDIINDSMYFTPALRFAAMANVKSALGKAIFYDTIIQQGWQYTERDINIYRNIMLTGGPKKSSESEEDYLARFLKVRRTILCCANDDNVWPDSADRVDDLQTLLAKGDLEFKNSVRLSNYGFTISGNENPDKDFVRKTCSHN
jgi:hypothetical protein